MGPKARFGIHVSSWRGAGAALHYYGRVWRDESGAREEIELEYAVTADEARALNLKDEASWMGSLGKIQRGDMTKRYSDLGRMLDQGLAHIAERWRHTGRVEWGEPMDCEAPLLQRDDGTPGPARTNPPAA